MCNYIYSSRIRLTLRRWKILENARRTIVQFCNRATTKKRRNARRSAGLGQRRGSDLRVITSLLGPPGGSCSPFKLEQLNCLATFVIPTHRLDNKMTDWLAHEMHYFLHLGGSRAAACSVQLAWLDPDRPDTDRLRLSNEDVDYFWWRFQPATSSQFHANGQ